MSVLIVTSSGDLVVDLYTDHCPLTSKNFLKLCKIKYYNGSLFHTIQKDFAAQTGDPTGTGSGGDSVYKFLHGDHARFFGDEIHLDVKHSKIGTLAMASAGDNLNASQFYITLRDNLNYLDGKHTVFGEVAEGLDTLSRINEAPVDQNSRPFKNIRIKHTYILYDPFDDPPQLSEFIPDASPRGKPIDEVDDDVRLEDDWVPMDEQLNAQEIEEVLRAKEAHSSAVVLETIGDIPDVDAKPPENVLFVCKLNPATEDGELHTIFSRFGPVTRAEIIRDHKSERACATLLLNLRRDLLVNKHMLRRRMLQMWFFGSHCTELSFEFSSHRQRPKYALEDRDTQRSGDSNARCQMVFHDDVDRSIKPKKRRGDDKVNSKRANRHEVKNQDGRKRDSQDRRNRNDTSKE